MSTKEKSRDDGVSPVVGVMLMLVVTIIIAAVVSAYSGGLASGQQKAPQLTGVASITNTGQYVGSSFSMSITGTSEPIPTRNLKLITTWTSRDGHKANTVVMPNGNTYSVAGKNLSAPIGSGPGVDKWGMVGTVSPEQHWGNYTLTTGTSFDAIPMGLNGPMNPTSNGGYGVTPSGVESDYTYHTGTKYVYGTDTDSIQAVLGTNWSYLRQGDTVRVQLLHIPSGKMIFDQNVVVKGSS